MRYAGMRRTRCTSRIGRPLSPFIDPRRRTFPPSPPSHGLYNCFRSAATTTAVRAFHTFHSRRLGFRLPFFFFFLSLYFFFFLPYPRISFPVTHTPSRDLFRRSPRPQARKNMRTTTTVQAVTTTTIIRAVSKATAKDRPQ